MSGQLYILDPRPFHSDQFRKLFCRKKGFDQIHSIDNINAALELAEEYNIKTNNTGSHSFFLCGIAYLYLYRLIETIHAEIPSARICVFDEKPYCGCGIIAERLCIHGFCSCFDEEPEVHRCLRCLSQSTAAVGESMRTYLRICFESRRLRCHADYLDLPLHRLSDKELDCFLHIVAEKTPEELADEWGLEIGSMNNFLLRIRQKLGIKHTSQFVEIANACGWGRGNTTESQIMRVVS